MRQPGPHPTLQNQIEAPLALPAGEIPGALPEHAAGQPLAERSAMADIQPGVRPARGNRGGLRRAAGAVALTGFMLLGGGHHAEAATPDTISASAEAQPQGSGLDWSTEIPLGVSVLTAGAGIVALQRQTKEKRQARLDRAIERIGELDDTSTGEQRGARLHSLASFARDRAHTPEVLESAIGYLRSRRGSLVKLRNTYKDDPAGLESAITERRNADRSAFKLFLATLPAARRQLHRQGLRTRIRERFGSKVDEQQALAELTGGQPIEESPRIDARGINLDDMRGMKKANLRDVDLTGAGLQRLQITSTFFTNARLSEAQLEGTTVSRSNLSGADLRAAYLHGAKFEKCVINEGTKFGNLPDDHPDSKYGSLDPAQPEAYRGNTEVVLKDLVSATLSPKKIAETVKDWQRNGLKLLGGSNHEYFLNEQDDPDWTPPAPAAKA